MIEIIYEQNSFYIFFYVKLFTFVRVKPCRFSDRYASDESRLLSKASREWLKRVSSFKTPLWLTCL